MSPTTQRRTFLPPAQLQHEPLPGASQADQVAVAAVLPRDILAYVPFLLPLIAWAIALYLPVHWSAARWLDIDSPQSYQPLVPLGAAALAWQRRTEIAQTWHDTRTLAPGMGSIGLALAGGICLLTGHVLQLGILGLWGGVIMLAGAVQCLWGWAVLRVLAPALGFLLLTAPLPNTVLGPATENLQLGCTWGAGNILQNLGVPNLVEGNQIVLPHFVVQVIAPCSGVSILCPVLVLTLLILLWRRASVLVIVPMLLVAGLLALVANVLRITAIGLIGSARPNLAHSLHEPLSLAFTIVAFVGVGTLTAGARRTTLK